MDLKRIAIQSYRHLLRAQKKVFRSDSNTLNRKSDSVDKLNPLYFVEALKRSRMEFESSRDINNFEALRKVQMPRTDKTQA